MQSSPIVVGLDFGGSKIAVAAAPVGAAPLATTTLAVRPEDTARHTFDRALSAAHALVTEITDDDPVAVGACTFGVPRMDGVDLAPTIPGWEQLPFGTLLHEAFPGARVRMATDVKAAAQAELDEGALAGCQTGLYLNLGTGLAAALIVGGQVVSGHHGAAGEIGYNLRTPLDGTATSLEQAVSGKALAAAAAALFGDADVAALAERSDTDQRAHRIWNAFVAELAYHLVNVTIALDPERVVVGGGLVRAWGRLRAPLAAALEAAVPFPPLLTVAAFPFDAPLRGALALATAAYRSSPELTRDSSPEGAPA